MCGAIRNHKTPGTPPELEELLLRCKASRFGSAQRGQKRSIFIEGSRQDLISELPYRSSRSRSLGCHGSWFRFPLCRSFRNRGEGVRCWFARRICPSFNSWLRLFCPGDSVRVPASSGHDNGIRDSPGYRGTSGLLMERDERYFPSAAITNPAQ